MDLTFHETRVLGVLIEKSLAQPAYYPMTVNAITNACNQKTNRDPVTDLSESEVSAALSSLRRRDLAQQAEPEPNSRSVKFRHKVDTAYGWNAAQRALMAELFLRGPLTLAELRAKASRMTHLESNDYARELLSELERHEPPLVEELEREPGRSARRFQHLMSGKKSPAVETEVSSTAAIPQLSEAQPEKDSILARLSKLEEAISELRSEMASLRNRDD